MYFPAVMSAGRIRTRTVTVPQDGKGTCMVYQDTFNADHPVSKAIKHLVGMAPEGRDIQEIKVTKDD